MVDKKGKEMVIKQEAKMPVEVFSPQVVVDQARQAAKALTNVIEQKPNKVVINGEQYLTFEDWQTLGKFYGITVGATETGEILRDNKIYGFTAKAMAWQKGIQISAAEASCLRDEKNWINKPEFQLKSMAQTRACAKALRNVLAWVAVLAGYQPTPVEEMTNNGNGKGKCLYCGAVGKYHKKGCPGAKRVKKTENEEIDIDEIAKKIV